MSVINQMLRDLEQRKVKDSIADHYIDEVNIIAKRQFNPLWFSLLALAVVLIAGMILYLSSAQKNSPAQVIDKQLIQNAEIQKSALTNLANNLSDIKQPLAKVMDTPLLLDSPVNLPAEAHLLANNKTVQAIAVKENSETKKAYKQASVNIKTVLKPEQQVRLNTEVKITESSKETAKAINVLPETAVVVKVPVKSSVKSIVNKKTTEQVVYQARQLMTLNQTAAIQLLEENLKEVSPDTDYYSLLANLQQRRQKFDKAIVYYRKALEIAPQKGELWIGIALAYRGTGEQDNAVRAFKQALITDEISSELRNYALQQISSP